MHEIALANTNIVQATDVIQNFLVTMFKKKNKQVKLI